MKFLLPLTLLLLIFSGCSEESQLRKIAGKIILDSLDDPTQYKFVSYRKTSEVTLAESLTNKIGHLELQLHYQENIRRANLTLDSLSVEMIKMLEQNKEYRLIDKEKLKRREYHSLIKNTGAHVQRDSLTLSGLLFLRETLGADSGGIVLLNYEYILQREDSLSTFFVQIDPVAGLVVNITEEERFLYTWYDPNIPAL